VLQRAKSSAISEQTAGWLSRVQEATAEGKDIFSTGKQQLQAYGS
jgi:hypothetical protein